MQLKIRPGVWLQSACTGTLCKSLPVILAKYRFLEQVAIFQLVACKLRAGLAYKSISDMVLFCQSREHSFSNFHFGTEMLGHKVGR